MAPALERRLFGAAKPANAAGEELSPFAGDELSPLEVVLSANWNGTISIRKFSGGA